MFTYKLLLLTCSNLTLRLCDVSMSALCSTKVQEELHLISPYVQYVKHMFENDNISEIRYHILGTAHQHEYPHFLTHSLSIYSRVKAMSLMTLIQLYLLLLFQFISCAASVAVQTEDGAGVFGK